MRKPLLVIFIVILVCGLQLLTFGLRAQQLKLGNNPTQIEKSAVLELESNNQGLLLTRVPDTGAINALNPPDGMIIYFTDFKVTVPYGPNAGIYQRKDGKWQRIAQFFTVSDSPGPHEDIEFTRSYDTITLHLPDATPSVRGVVNDGNQTFGGNKYFNDSLIATGGFRAYNAQIDDSLILSKFSNSTDPTEWFLSTNAKGNVFLQKIDDVFWKLGGNNISAAIPDSLGTLSNTDLPIITHGIDRIHITKEGKVGIGTSTPADTLDVEGSFKLGAGGSSFSKMAHAVVSYKIDTAGSGYIVRSPLSPIIGIKTNAHIIVNPRSSLQDEVNSSIAAVAWVRAPADNTATICFHTSGKINITVSFDIYYINSASP